MNDVTREELIWWYNPKLIQWRGWFQEYFARGQDWCQGEETEENRRRREELWRDSQNLGMFFEMKEPDNTQWSFVASLPVLLFIRGKWEMEKLWLLDEAELFAIRDWEPPDRIDPKKQKLRTLWRVLYVLNDPRTVDADTIPEKDDTARVIRFTQAAFERFVLSDNPAVPSLWKEGDKVLCGWNNLYPDDRRTPPRNHGYNMTQPLYWNGAYFGNVHEWRHMVPQ